MNKMEVPINWEHVTNDTPSFTLENEIKEAKVVDVYDGDTIKVVFEHHGKLWKWRVRLLRINAAELRNDERIKGIEVRNFLRNLILGKVVTVACHKFDAFGRILGEVTYETENVSDTLLQLGLVVPFS